METLKCHQKIYISFLLIWFHISFQFSFVSIVDVFDSMIIDCIIIHILKTETDSSKLNVFLYLDYSTLLNNLRHIFSYVSLLLGGNSTKHGLGCQRKLVYIQVNVTIYYQIAIKQSH